MPRLRPLPSESGDAAKPARVSSRGKLNAEFVEALARDFETYGPDVIAPIDASGGRPLPLAVSFVD